MDPIKQQVHACRILAARLTEWSGAVLATRWALDGGGLSQEAAGKLEEWSAEMARASAFATVEADTLERPTEYALAAAEPASKEDAP